MMKYEKERASDQHLPGEILDAFWRNVGKVVDFRMIGWNFIFDVGSSSSKIQVLARNPHLRGDRGPLVLQWLDLCEVGEVFCNPDFSILYMAWYMYTVYI